MYKHISGIVTGAVVSIVLVMLFGVGVPNLSANHFSGAAGRFDIIKHTREEETTHPEC